MGTSGESIVPRKRRETLDTQTPLSRVEKKEPDLEDIETLETLYKELQENHVFVDDLLNFPAFFKLRVRHSSAATIAHLIKQRRTWNAFRSHTQSQNFLEKKIREHLDQEVGFESYVSIILYRSMGYANISQFLGEVLNNKHVRDNPDGSKWGRVLEYLAATRNPEAVDSVVRALESVVTEKGGVPISNTKLHYAVSALKVLAGDKTKEILEQISSKSPTFGTWLQVNKLQIFGADAHNLFEHAVYTPEPFNAEKEEARIAEMEQAYEENLHNAPHSTHLAWDYDMGNDDNIYDHYEADEGANEHHGSDDDVYTYEPDDIIGHATPKHETPGSDVVKRGGEYWKHSMAVNFYGRYGAEKEIEGYTAVSQENYQQVLRALVHRGTELTEKDFYHFLNNKIKSKLIETSAPALNIKQLSELARVGSARILYLMRVENRHEDALMELRALERIVAAEEPPSEDTQKPTDMRLILGELAAVETVVVENTDQQFRNSTSLPKSADEFLMYHSGYQKSRLIPSYETLLAEKIRRFLALELFHNTHPQGVSETVERILNEYQRNKELYREVEKNDVPLYWEAKEKLEDFDANRCVVFGRDGRYFFTALKAGDFGIGEKDLKYLVVTRNMQSSSSQEEITRYLTQHGATLDFTFVDTGFSGSIPEFAISLLAQESGVTLSSNEVDNKIKLLSSSHADRQEISRKRGGRGAQTTKVNSIEDRPQRIESPRYLQLKNGKLEPVEAPTSVDQQLAAWTVEHAVFRNFAPRLDGEKRLVHLRINLLENWEYSENLGSTGAISTHPIEIWKNKVDGTEALLKGGPEHTLRAEFVGNKFFEKMLLPVPEDDLIYMENGLRFKMKYLKDLKGGGITLPEEHKNNVQIQRGFLVDMLVGQYDRTPWNLMFSKSDPTHVAFIDHGGCLNSRARGGYKGFNDRFTIEEMSGLLKSPQFPDKPVNEAYANFVEVRGSQIVIKNPSLMRDMLLNLQWNIKREDIEDIIDQAGYPDGRRSIDAMQKKIQEFAQTLNNPATSEHDKKLLRGAIETYEKAIAAGGEATYFKKALIQRYRDIIKLISHALELPDSQPEAPKQGIVASTLKKLFG